MKKVLPLFLLAFVLILGACGNDESQSESVEESEEKVQTEVDGSENVEIDENEEMEQTEIEQEASKEEEQQEIPHEAVNEEPMTNENLKEIIEYTGVGEGDELVSSTMDNGKIKAVIKLAHDNLFPDKDIAVLRYSQISDELLDHEGWDVLTIEYVGIGTIRMNRSEKESNEYGDYFPTLEIENRLK